MNFKAEYLKRKNLIDDRLNSYLEEDKYAHLTHSKQIIEIMRYAILSGGKRIRPVLLISAHHLVGGDMDESLSLACAIEMIHNYSLIHDDLPAMDDDDYRRGRHTVHKKYGEDMAILAGDALLNLAYEVMIDNVRSHPDNIYNHLEAMGIVARASGIDGMISGQVADLYYEDREIGADTLDFIHSYKTGALISAAVMSGAILEDIDADMLEHLRVYGHNIGLAFQVTDDIMDITGSFEEMGKAVGSDQANKKNTFPSLHGLDESKNYVKDLITEAVDRLSPFGEGALFLQKLALDIIDRRS